MVQGIYEICNLYDGGGTAYIGSSVNVKCRWAQHRSCLCTEQHCNARLQAAWNKYGEVAFEWSVVEKVTDIDEFLGCEQRWLNRYLERPATCYNIVACAMRRKFSGVKKKRLSLTVDSDITKKAKKKAVDEETSVSAEVERHLREWVKDPPPSEDPPPED